ncbi:MAG: M24 family metallopeptidase [Actinobacteria bacterium]|nr:MAG: M24 family metallopeptidase [Actinomycetota bacterium]
MSDRFAARRSRIAESIGEDGIAVIPAAVEQIRNDDVPHDFRQDSTFFYLTGFIEPDAVAVLTPGHSDGDYTLFVRARDPEMEAWNGYRAGVEGAKETYGADAAYPIGELDEVLTRLMIGREVLWYRTGNDKQDDRMTALISKARSHRSRYGGSVPSTVKDISVPLDEMRLVKSQEERASLEAACRLSAQGHSEAMRFARPGLYEYQVQAAMEYGWRMGGSKRNGYGSIVASGANACILHYVENDDLIEDGDLILIDAAAEVDGYSADITRTFPASGKFTAPQRALYELVLEAEKLGIEMSEPGSSMRAIHDAAVRTLTEGMVELGLLPMAVEDSLAMHHYKEFYFHGTGHWLGMDVHDAGMYRKDGKPRPLEPGMAFTVEPGIYVAPGKKEIELTLLEYDPDEWVERRILEGRASALAKEQEARESAEKITHTVPEEFLGLGLRIEDDIIITSDGCDNLTSGVPKEVDEVEAMCAESPTLPA